MICFLRGLARSVVRLGSSDSGCRLRMPATLDRLSRLREQLREFDSLPYAAAARKFKAEGPDSFSATQALPLIAERLSLPETVKDFDPTPFLSPLFRQVYEDPSAFLKPQEEIPEPVQIRGTATRRELLKVMGRWDNLQRLFICKASEVCVEDTCELFAVAKDEHKDRQILHRKRRNR